jgi:uncharacterized pyridoxamine 5'-phosphate oxidase family protein
VAIAVTEEKKGQPKSRPYFKIISFNLKLILFCSSDGNHFRHEIQKQCQLAALTGEIHESICFAIFPYLCIA